jgi:hypothetical protein
MQTTFQSKMNRYIKKGMAFAMAATTLVTTLTSNVSFASSKVDTIDKVSSYGKYYAPFSLDTNNDGETETVWSTFTYGEYPQTQVTDDATIAQLENLDSEEWEAVVNPYQTYLGNNNQTVALAYIGNDCYLRMKMSDSNNGQVNASNGYYNWDDADTYHYFKFEPIKWRVLSVNEDGSDALVVADQVLDCQLFNYTMADKYYNGYMRASNYWKYSTIRSFINSYDAAQNMYNADYTEYGFSYLGFTDAELTNVISSDLDDKFFCLSFEQLNTKAYGFNSDDERVTTATDYAKHMGAFGANAASFWWSKSYGNTNFRAGCVDYEGDIHTNGDETDCDDIGVRPAMHINLANIPAANFAGYVDTYRNSYSCKISFKLDGVVNGYSLVNADTNMFDIPSGYEEEGYDYTYTYGNKTLSFPMTATKNFTINVTRKAQATATPEVTEAPTAEPTAVPTAEPTAEPTAVPTAEPTAVPTTVPTAVPTAEPTAVPTVEPTVVPTVEPTAVPTATPTAVPTATPTVAPKHQVTVYYNTSWTAPRMHYCLDGKNWTEVPGLYMTSSTARSSYNFEYTLDAGDAKTLTVCFYSGGTPWDNNNGANYTIDLTKGNLFGIKDRTVKVLSENPEDNIVTIYYNTGWVTPNIHYQVGNGAWTPVPGVRMVATNEQSGYTYKYVIQLGDEDKISVCFNNGNNSWDNNRNANYNIYNITAAGVYGISNGVIYKLS